MQRSVIKISEAQIGKCATGRQLYVLLQTAGVRLKKRDVWPESAAEYAPILFHEDIEQPCTIIREIKEGILILSQLKPVLRLAAPSGPPPSTSV
jgi:hypothetical protein